MIRMSNRHLKNVGVTLSLVLANSVAYAALRPLSTDRPDTTESPLP